MARFAGCHGWHPGGVTTDEPRTGDDQLVAGRYRLIRRLGAGGMGVVWQAYDERLHRTVAVKHLLLPVDPDDPKARQARRQAMVEGRIAARLQHPNAIAVYDVAEHAGQPYLVMEYLRARSLSEVLAERGTLQPVAVAAIGAQTADALASAHAAGVVHRDVKPGNVLLGDDGTVKITDFGISRAVEDVTGTATAMIAGTPAYLAPEVARGERASFSSDVFSLGSTLYTALEGTPPFGTSDNPMALLYRVASGQVRPPSRTGPVTEAVMRMLRAEPDRRPSMPQAEAAFAALADGASWAGGTTALLPRTDAATTERTAQGTGRGAGTTERADPGRRRTAGAIFAAVALLALAGILLALALDRRDPGSAAPQVPAPTAASPTSAAVTQTPSETQPPTTTQAPPTTQPPQAPPRTPEQAIVDYYALMPDDLQEGWSRLTADYQRSPAGGFDGYQAFWSQMRSVRTSDVTTRQDGVVDATVEYTFDDGRVVEERHGYWLVEQGGEWLIDRSTVISSVTKRSAG